MKIAINTRFLLSGKPLEGLGRYTLEISKNLVLSHPEHEFYFFFDRPFDDQFIFAKNVHPIVINPAARHPFLFYVWFEWQIPKYLKKYGIDVFFSPDNFLSLKTDCPTVLTIHDLAFLHHPKSIPLLARKYYQYFMPKFVYKAKHICSVSNFVREDLAKEFSVSLEKITTIYNALPSTFATIIPNSSTKEQKYFILAGSINPRKNTFNVLSAFDDFCTNYRRDFKIKIVGSFMDKPDSKLNDLIQKMKAENKLIHLSNISDELLIEEIKGSSGLLYLSLFEGFGLPILEGMACGAPVITSNITSMPEVAGNATFLADPYDQYSIVNAMRTVVENPELTAEKITLGYQRIKDFSYKKSAEQIYAVLEKVVLK